MESVNLWLIFLPQRNKVLKIHKEKAQPIFRILSFSPAFLYIGSYINKKKPRL